jgi:hypothetical protein
MPGRVHGRESSAGQWARTTRPFENVSPAASKSAFTAALSR